MPARVDVTGTSVSANILTRDLEYMCTCMTCPEQSSQSRLSRAQQKRVPICRSYDRVDICLILVLGVQPVSHLVYEV
jgi:hypothetical protein